MARLNCPAVEGGAVVISKEELATRFCACKGRSGKIKNGINQRRKMTVLLMDSK